MREQLKDALTTAMKAGEKRRVATVRLILAAIKDRDIAQRSEGKGDVGGEGVGDEEILGILQKMVKQRRESTTLYQEGGRMELAQQEEEEIAIIEEFLPEQIGGEEMEAAVAAAVDELGATSLKDMGGVMAQLKDRYAGRMDFAQAAGQVKSLLSK
ncbi:MAG: GatB/YqeY domain-containing protein [Alphaproteobacteria bacterium]|nr:GatB/YqeY domain-containing protein [Alphaproteobacteria bacterium]